MDHQTIQAIATEVAKHLSGYAWVALALQVSLVAVAGAAAALLGAYLKKTGEHLATMNHFEEMLRQLGERTKVVETIKADVAKSQLEIIEAVKSEFAQRDWASRERATLRRVKIEELLGKVNECRAYLERYQKAAAEGDGLEERDPIAKLYLPELAAQTKAFSDMHELQVHEGLLHRHKLSRLSTEEKQRELKMDYGWQVAKSKKSGEADALIEAARKLLEDTMAPQARSEGGTRQTERASGTNSP
jgi:hypothetical protein